MFLRHNNHEAPLGPSPKPMDFQQAGGSAGFGGETFITSTTTTSTVVSIDAVTRTLQLKQSNGKTTAYKAGPEVANFDQIKIGDLVQATVAEELAVDDRWTTNVGTNCAGGKASTNSYACGIFHRARHSSTSCSSRNRTLCPSWQINFAGC